jgi:hypothetical protein
VGPAQMAILLMMRDQELAAKASNSHRHSVARASFMSRLGRRLRRISYRAQLGPVAGPAVV